MVRFSKGLRVKTAALPIELKAKKHSSSDLDIVKTINFTYLVEIQPCTAATIIYPKSSPWKLDNFKMNRTIEYKTCDVQINSH
jgi:hypothetical protein